MEIKKERYVTHLLHVHLVFVTKYRYKVLKDKHIDYLRDIFKETIEKMGGTLDELHGGDEYVHLLIQYPPRRSISKIVNNLKGRSSRLIRRDMPDIKKMYLDKPCLWDRAYFAGSVDGSQIEIVEQYIEQQSNT
jgi:putative transposase